MQFNVELGFSEDDLTVTNAAATYTDVTASLLEIEWSGGVQKEGDDPNPGMMRCAFDDPSRNFEPEYVAGAFYPNIVPERRFKLVLDVGGVDYPQGLFYAVEFRPTQPDRATEQETVVTCADGFAVLALNDLPGLDPPDAQSYADVVAFDQPWGYWRLGEFATETQTVSRVKTVTRGTGKRRRKVKRRTNVQMVSVTDAAAAGPSGVYQTRSLLGLEQPGLIVGDSDTCMLAVRSGTNSGHVTVAIEDVKSLSEGNAVSVEAWVKAGSFLGVLPIVSGPAASGGLPIFVLYASVNGVAGFAFGMFNGSSQDNLFQSGITLEDTIHHVVGTWDGTTQRLYIDGVLVEQASRAFNLGTPAANPVLRIGREPNAPDAFDGYIDEVAIYEHALTPERVLAHYTAGSARGFPQQTAGERIEAICDDISIWSTARVQTAGRQVQPQMMVGQGRLEEIAETMQAEGPRTLFFPDGSGDPVYLGHEWKATSGDYNTVQATFGNLAGEVPYVDVGAIPDDEFYRTVVASREGGPTVEVSEGTPPRVNSEYTDVLLADDDDVESLAHHVLDLYKTPQYRFEWIDLDGDNTDARNQLLIREIGDLVRIKHRPRGGTAVDRIQHIIGYEKRIERETRKLTGRFYLGRAVNASLGQWQAGIVGFSEAGVTTVAG